MRLGHHLRQRGYTWFFRYRWPVRLAGRGGSGELIRSLRTTDRRIALWRARILAVKIETLLMQQPLPSRSQVESSVRAWIDDRVWAHEIRRAETNGFDFLEPDEIETLNEVDKDAARELEGLLRFADLRFAGQQKGEIASVLRGERDGARFEPIIQAASKSMEKSVDRSTVEGKVWARTILRGFATFLDEIRETVAAIPKYVAPNDEPVYPSFKFLMHWDAFEAHKVANLAWKTDTAANARGSHNVFNRLFPDATIRLICVTALASDLKTTLLSMPKDYSRGGWAVMSIPEMIAKAKRLATASPKHPKKLIPTMAIGTVNKHFANLGEYWDYLVEKKLVAAEITNPFEGFHTAKKKGRGARNERNNWPLALENKFFSAPWACGCKSIYRRAIPGNEIHRDGMFWVTLWGRLTGVRENEIADALVGAIKFEETDGARIPYLEIIDGKDSGSERNVPIPDFLLEAGFLEYRVLGRNPDEPLFPELIEQGPGSRRSAAFSGKFTTLRMNSGCYLPKVDYHSFRGNVETTLKNTAGINENWIDELIGHESPIRRSEGSRYTKAILLPILQRCVNTIRINADLSHLRYAGPRDEPAPGRDREIARYVALAEREMRKKASRKKTPPPAKK
ncbi:MAG: hypothetical protein Q7T45_22100 [Bradyrhizobium sp.]|uniref:DUF6538 domain-containing protein n=1 Tax=Bradyrhizobium sp. TaxID=376 RepID=UPI00272560AE|nr:DUF6538 domain-containing protein [Bradyrhizobium sp.]MDO8400515.1 hypothetical protein [Bradyrhizobium sp.]